MSVETAVATREKGWRARWYLWDGGFLAIGPTAPGAQIPPHSHHAIQICVSLEGAVRLKGAQGDWVEHPGGAMVAPDVVHEFDAMGTVVAMLFVDPETREGGWLQRSLRGAVTAIPAAKSAPTLEALRAFWEEPLDAAATAAMVHSMVRGLCVGPPPTRSLDPRILRALEAIRRMDTAKISQEAVARAVFLSSSRFAHLFSEEVGLPFRRYLLWRRLTRAMLAVGRGSTLSGAAHTCGFSDSAHLTRACYQMFGIPPSMLMAPGEFYEIPAPFELPVPTA